MIKRVIAGLLFVFLSFPQPCFSKLNFGVINAVKKKVSQLKKKIDNVKTVIPQTTKVLDEQSVQSMSLLEDSMITFEQSTSKLESLSIEDVIIIGVSSHTPNGLLRKVIQVEMSGDKVLVKTAAATLVDAIETGSFSLNKTLTSSDVSQSLSLIRGATFKQALPPQRTLALIEEIDNVILYDVDGNEETTNDQIKVNGSISITPSFDFQVSIRNFQLIHVKFINTTVETSEIDLDAGITLDITELLGIPKEVEIIRHYFSPIVIWVGWVPVVIVPVLTVSVGLDGEVSVGLSAGVTQEATITAGIEYSDGNWNPISDFSNDFQFIPPELSAGCQAKAYAGPRLSLLLYGVTGPYGNVNGYLELEADILSTPWWILYGGIEVNAGVRFEILSEEIFDYEIPKIIDYRMIIAQAETSAPVQTGSISGNVKDAVTDSPLQGVAIKLYDDNTLIATGTSESNGNYSLSVPVGSEYKVEFSKEGYITAMYQGISVEPDSTVYLETVLQIDTSHSGTGDVSGKIINALDGTGVNGLTINLREGINVRSGSVIATTTSGSNGYYSFANLNAGHYTAEVSGDGYVTTYFTILCIGGTTITDQDASISPIIPEGETRIVLTWGATPSDLDSHLTCPVSGSIERFHIYYANKGSIDTSPYVALDLDDITSYGPETTTIYQQIDGIYRFSIHDYSNKYSASSYALSNSGAQIRVYRGENLIANFSVPSNQGGTLWTVFEMSGETITSVNRMSYESSSGNIESFAVGLAITDAILMKNLPQKK
ncbi:MAG: carboxypeptidase regulatory-like domain-containing protein [Planctomycetota bacterium]